MVSLFGTIQGYCKIVGLSFIGGRDPNLSVEQLEPACFKAPFDCKMRQQLKYIQASSRRELRSQQNQQSSRIVASSNTHIFNLSSSEGSGVAVELERIIDPKR